MELDFLKSGARLDISAAVSFDPVATRKILDESRQDLYRQHFAQVKDRLSAWISQCEAYLGARFRGAGERESILRTQMNWLLGVAQSVLGQAELGQGDTAAAHSIFDQALDHFVEPAAETPWVTGQERADFGFALSARGRTEEALTCWRAALESGLPSAQAYAFLAGAFDKFDLAAEAEAALRKSLELTPSADGYELLARILERQGKREAAAYQYGMAALILLRLGQAKRAEELAGRSLLLSPEDPQLLSMRANALLASSRPQEALLAANQALVFDPDQVEALVARAKAQEALGLYDDALATCERVLALHPAEPEASVLMSTVLLVQGRKKEAAAAIHHLIDSLPDVPQEARPGLASFFWQAEQYEDAIRWADRALEGDPKNEVALRSKIAAVGALVTNNSDSALLEDSLSALDRLLELPVQDRPQLGFAKIMVLESLGRAPEALAVAEQFAAGERAPFSILEALVRLLLAANRPKDALEAANKALAIEQNAGMLVQKGRLLVILGGEAAEAVEALNAALTIQPDNALGYFMRGLAQFDLNHFEEALHDFEHYSVLQSSDPEGLYWQGYTLLRLKRYEEALAALEKYRLAKPDQTKALRELAEAHFGLRQLSDAQHVLEKLRKAEPDNVDDLLRLVDFCKAAGEHERALDLLREEAVRRPDQVRVLRRLTEDLKSAKKDAESVPFLERLTALEPKNGQSQQDLAFALLAVGRTEDALAAIQAAVDLEPENRTFRSSKAAVLRGANRNQDALNLCDELLLEKPDDAFVLATKGAALSALDRTEDALAALDKTLELEAKWEFPLTVKAGALCDAAEFQRALEVLEQIAEGDRSTSYYWLVRGWALENLGFVRTEETLQCYDKAIFYDGDEIYAYRGRGDMHRRLNHPEAVRDYEWIIDRASRPSGLTQANAVALKGWSCYGLGRVEEAEKYLIDALTLDRTLISVQFDLAIIVLCRGRGRLAHREYRQGVELCLHKTPARRKGLITVARRDLTDAVRLNPKLTEMPELSGIAEMLKRALDPPATQSAGLEPAHTADDVPQASAADVH